MEGFEEGKIPIGIVVAGLIDGIAYELWTLSKDNDWCWWIGDYPDDMNEFMVNYPWGDYNYLIELIGDAWIINVTPPDSDPGPDLDIPDSDVPE